MFECGLEMGIGKPNDLCYIEPGDMGGGGLNLEKSEKE